MTDPKATTTVIFFWRRNPNLTLQECYEYWQNQHARICVPWMEKHGWLGYRQIQTAGTISKTSIQTLPHSTAYNSTEPSGGLFHFDGIFFAEVPLHVNFVDAYKDPYYTHVIAPDEHVFVDKSGKNDAILATYEGRTMTIVDHGKNAIGDKASPERKRWKEFEDNARTKAEVQGQIKANFE
ncbi:EthD domain-containing protein [Venturia nashicola]|uniref:EthD domain-containing protein n=1 Tax=Venturia nashicola TaxID=86259 RepID=A0A4Z1PUG3_9PEZI|nr:EthD domain-containing protein [Venturia nashicola]TLD39717.1 EthD domain-containing protein [Venturia nashicola]